jgi:hypothetical protein
VSPARVSWVRVSASGGATGATGSAGWGGGGAATTGSGAVGAGAAATGAVGTSAGGSATAFLIGFLVGGGSLANFSRSRRTTGASTVEEADRTNSPISPNVVRTVLLSTPSSFASS